MKRKIIQTRQFSKTVDNLLKRRQLLQADFDDFKRTTEKRTEAFDRSYTGGKWLKSFSMI